MDFMEWLRVCKEWEETEIQGEYWIDENGTPNYCDGDIGDTNHEGVVVDALQRQIAGDRYEKMDHIDWDRYLKDLVNEIYREKMRTATSEQAKKIKDVYLRNAMSFLDAATLKKHGIDPEAFSYACGNGNARDYAMKHWRWKRVLNNNVETWTFDQRDRRIIANGLAEILFDESGIEEERSKEVTFYVSVHSNGQSFDMTLGEIEFGHQEPPRAVGADINQHQNAATNFTQAMDQKNVPSFYRGKLGDWHIPRI